MRTFKVKEGYIVSYETELEKEINGNTIRMIPAFKFLLNPENYF
jgi:predicted AAA+ superfamily ATPase